MFQRNDQTLFHLLLFERHSKESTSHLPNKLLLTLLFMFNKLSLAETLWDSHYVKTHILDSLDRNTNTSQDEGLLKRQHTTYKIRKRKREKYLAPDPQWYGSTQLPLEVSALKYFYT